jgi:hypothetical protein
VYGPVRTVVWQGSAGDRRPYADQTRFPDKWLILPTWTITRLKSGVTEHYASVQEMAGPEYCTTEGAEAKEDKAEDGVDEAEEVRADAVWDESNDDR